jgi:hypothetical protein
LDERDFRRSRKLQTKGNVITRTSAYQELQKAATIIVKEREKILDILTTGPRSKPRSRKINGAKRTRAPKEVAA